MNRKAFHLLLKKYVNGKCSPEEHALVDQWYELLDDEGLLSVEEQDLSLLEDRIWSRIQGDISLSQKALPKKKILLPRFYKWVAAAIVIFIIVGGFLLVRKQQFNKTEISSTPQPVFKGKDWHTTTNNTTVSMAVSLPDNSMVKLQPGASLSYPAKWSDDKREVYLDGAALFKVTRNPARPFLVYTGTIVTQVLGTSFTIQKNNNQYEVAVLTGKVAVYEEGNKQQHDKGGVVITPNEKVTYYTENHHFITALVDNPVAVKKEEDSTAKETFVFDETPMQNIIAQLEENYSVQILAENEKINDCLFTGNLSGQTLYNQLDVICQAIGANYEIRGTSIILTGNGCN